MTSQRLILIALSCLVASAGPASGQVMLVGCTANTTPTGPTTRLVDFDLSTGAATNPRDTGVFAIGGIAYQPSNGLLYGLTTFVSNPANSLVSIDINSGAVTTIGPTGLVNIVEGDLAFNPITDQLYGIQYVGPANDQRSLFQINPLTGTASVIGSIGAVGDFSAMSFDLNGNLFIVDTQTDSLLTIDSTTAAVLSSTPLNVNLGAAAGMTFHPITGDAYLSDGSGGTNSLYLLNISTGAASIIGPTGAVGGIAGLTFVAVPEPSSLLLFGVAAICGFRKRFGMPVK